MTAGHFDSLYEFELDEICGGYVDMTPAPAPAVLEEAAAIAAGEPVGAGAEAQQARATGHALPAAPRSEAEIESFVNGLLATAEGRNVLDRIVRPVGNGFYDVTLRLPNGWLHVERVWLFEDPGL